MSEQPSTSREPESGARDAGANDAHDASDFRIPDKLSQTWESDSDSDLEIELPMYLINKKRLMNRTGNPLLDEIPDFFDSASFEEIDDDVYDELDAEFELGEDPHHIEIEVPLFPQNPEELDKMCEVCYEMKNVRKRLCCNLRVCDACVDSYVEDRVQQGIVKIGCMAVCDSFIYRDEILGRLDPEMKDKYYKFLIDANKDPYIKTCPRCSHVKQVSKAQLDDKIVIKKGLEVVCDKCELRWCFPCHGPWHEGLTCKDYRKGDRLLQMWALEMRSGQVNAQRCPRCKIFIQRTSGCDHMTCSSCKTSFCYRCGKRYRSFKMFGNHFSRYSLFGCKYNLLPKQPGARRFVRGAVFGGKLLGSAVLAGFALAAGAVFIGTSVVVVPAIVGYKLMKRRRMKRRIKQRMTTMMHPHTDPRFLLDLENTLTFENQNLRGEPNILRFHEDDIADRSLTNFFTAIDTEDEQQVEVLVHRTLVTGATSSDTGENSNDANPVESTKEKPVVTLTKFTQEVTEGGYTRVVAHVISKNVEEPNAESNSVVTGEASKNEKTVTDSDRKLSKASDVDSELNEVDLDLGGDSNGCFVNIFSKKLNAWQVHNTLPNASISAKTILKMKSGTWEKSGKKLSTSSNFDLKTFSNILTSQSDKDIKSCDSSDNPQCSSSPEEEVNSAWEFVTHL